MKEPVSPFVLFNGKPLFMTPNAPLSSILLSAAVLTILMPVAGAQTAVAILPEKIEDAKGKKLQSSTLEGKFIGLYFSASWCGPCRVFTPHLIAFRDQHLEEFEVVLVSFDKSNTDKRRYIHDAGMNWPSVPGASRKISKTLSETYQVKGFPTLVILAPDGTLVTDRGVETIMSEPSTALEQWKQAPQS